MDEPIHFGSASGVVTVYRGREPVGAVRSAGEGKALALALLLGQTHIGGVLVPERLRMQIAHAALGLAI